ncbi:MAG: cobalt-precorrin-5B (C(1))-methyltransferase [Candidatus Methanoperedens sp.]|nr:cobalt-precorrin-5B (C(1))-methyltransferase [Candidatus Methanoperedens sp.]
MIDPVNNFKIPDEWIQRTNLPIDKLNSMILSGCYVLLSNGKLLRRGYTTGTTASAAAKGAVLSITKTVSEVEVKTPIGLRVRLPVQAEKGKASAFKFSGDHAVDVTNGMEIVACAKESENISIIAGKGIGIKKGSPAINPSPMRQIEDAIKEALVETGLRGAQVILFVPMGENITKKTLNEKIGIIGGISILGTTGFVEPWNEHLGEMKEELIKNADRVILTTGRIGVYFSHMLFPDHTVILIGSDISRGLRAAKGEVIICGLPGLILKWADPDILKKGGNLTVQEMIDSDPKNKVIDIALNEAVKKSGKRVVLLNRDGTILRDSHQKNMTMGGL